MKTCQHRLAFKLHHATAPRDRARSSRVANAEHVHGDVMAAGFISAFEPLVVAARIVAIGQEENVAAGFGIQRMQRQAQRLADARPRDRARFAVRS